jgi:hypothetical protein
MSSFSDADQGTRVSCTRYRKLFRSIFLSNRLALFLVWTIAPLHRICGYDDIVYQHRWLFCGIQYTRLFHSLLFNKRLALFLIRGFALYRCIRG